MSSTLRGHRPIREEGLWLRLADGENAVYDERTGAVHVLNDTALAVWHLCDGQTLPIEMIEAICQLSGLHEEVVTEDVDRILKEFERSRLVTWQEDA